MGYRQLCWGNSFRINLAQTIAANMAKIMYYFGRLAGDQSQIKSPRAIFNKAGYAASEQDVRNLLTAVKLYDSTRAIGDEVTIGIITLGDDISVTFK